MYLHGKGLSHGDVKAGNVLVDFEGGARLADLGTAQKVTASVELFFPTLLIRIMLLPYLI